MIGRAIVALLLLSAAATDAQTVRGIVRESDGDKLRGAFIMLLDSGGVMRLGTLSDENGRYAMRAPAPGRYLLRAELIGHGTITSAPFLLQRDSVLTADLTLPIAAIQLSGVTAKASRRCVAGPQSATQTQRLWEEVRKALRVTAWAQQQANTRVLTHNTVRMLNPYSHRVLSEEPGPSGTRGYAAVNPDTLARWGFARQANGDTIAYFGPDADLLLSDAFLDTHCFSTQRGKGETAGLIGLAFRPVPHRDVPEILGTLWLDPRNSELRRIDYRYTNLPHSGDERYAEGRTYFRRAPNGVWLVDHWYIRMPLRFRGGRNIGAVAALREESGEIVRLGTGESADVSAPGAVSGVVYDSVHASPLAGALVYLSGTSYRTYTDSAGRFTLDDLRAGSYQLAFGHALLDSLPVVLKALPVEIKADTIVLTLAVPSQATLVAESCPEHPQAGVLTGYVSDEGGSRLTQVEVNAIYATNEHMVRLHTTTDEYGRYVFCDVPQGRLIRVGSPGVGEKLAKLNKLRFVRLDL